MLKDDLNKTCLFEHDFNYIQWRFWPLQGKCVNKFNNKYFQKLIDQNEINRIIDNILRWLIDSEINIRHE